MGAVAVGAGWRWAALLLAFFIPATLLSRWRSDRKAARTSGILEKGGRRDATQVLANGGIFLVSAAGAIVAPQLAPWWLLAAGALAAATSDTWATETGTALGGQPRSLLTGQQLLPGESGGVTTVGTLGGATGALIAGVASVALMPGSASVQRPVQLALVVAAAGALGMLADSLLGATVQERRICPACAARTERRVHSCGTPTIHAGGIRWLGNDAVNLLATLTGAGAAVAVARWVGIV